MPRELIHYGIHFLVPVIVGIFWYPENRLRAVLILLSGMLIDLDHLMADPVFDPGRCSIGFHPLHTYPAIGIYALMLFFARTRIFALALLIHILADLADCLLLPFE